MDTFCKLPSAQFNSLGDISIGLFGASEASPYRADKPSHSANAPAAIRRASQGFAGQLRQFDFDLNSSLLGPKGETWGMVDCGDVPTDRADGPGNRERITRRPVLSCVQEALLSCWAAMTPCPFRGLQGSKGEVLTQFCRSTPTPTGRTSSKATPWVMGARCGAPPNF